MDAKKCDRCGEFYDVDLLIWGRKPDVINLIGGSIVKTYHLCPECMNTIIQFLKSGDES